MPPAKSSRNHDDKPESTSSKDKNGGHASAKMRRITSQQGGSQLREVTNASATAASQAAAGTTAPGIQWPTFEREALHSYRREYHLNTPSSFTSTFHQTVLSQPAGIGVYSPTMLRSKKKRQSKEQLTRAVRKHFNGLGVQENDLIADFIYKVRSDNAAKVQGPQKPSIIAE